MFKIIGSKIEKTKPYKINFKSLLINQEKNEIWIIPENNYLNVTYIFKEEGIQDQNKNYSYTNNNKLFLDPNKKHKNSVLQKKINLNLNINKDYKSMILIRIFIQIKLKIIILKQTKNQETS